MLPFNLWASLIKIKWDLIFECPHKKKYCDLFMGPSVFLKFKSVSYSYGRYGWTKDKEREKTKHVFIDKGYCTSWNEGLPTNNFRIWHSGHGGISEF